MNDQIKGLLITTSGVLLVVPDSLFVRLINAEPLITAFWRAIMSGVIVLVVVIAFQGVGGFKKLLQTGWSGVIYTVLIASTAPAFVLAISNTSVANVVFIFASMPVFAALLSWLFLGEGIDRRMVVTMVAVGFGLAIIAYGSKASEIASIKGDLWAVYISAAYAGALTSVRRMKGISMVPAIPIAYIGSALLMWPFITPMAGVETQWPLYLMHGLFIGAASCLLAIGPRYIRSSDVALLILLESVLAPLLVWLVINEHPGQWALIGGFVVIASLVISNLWNQFYGAAKQFENR